MFEFVFSTMFFEIIIDVVKNAITNDLSENLNIHRFFWGALIPLLAPLAGSLFDGIFGDDGKSADQVVQGQQQASRYDVTNPFGSATWDDEGNLTQEISPQMQEMMDKKFDYRNSALENALSWYGGPAPNTDNTEVGAVADTVNPYPGRGKDTGEYYDWGISQGWSDTPGDWGRDGNPGIPFDIVERGSFPTNMTPAQLETWWLNYNNDGLLDGRQTP